MITVVCNKCNNNFQVPDERDIPINLLCSQCGEPNMTFDVDVEATCSTCSQKTMIMGGVMFNAGHKKCHKTSWIVKAMKAVEKVVDGVPDFSSFPKLEDQAKKEAVEPKNEASPLPPIAPDKKKRKGK